MSFLERLLGSEPIRPSREGQFGFAVVGLGKIARHFLEGVKASPNVRVAAVVSGSAEKADKVAGEFHVPHALTYADFDSLKDLPGIDAVYIALPVSMHREYTERAAALGRHVLCEKPLAPTAADCRAMIAACEAAGVQLSVAMRPPYAAVHQHARHLVQTGVLGKIERIESVFGFSLKATRGDGDWRADDTLAGGGSLFDVGIYPLNAARFLLGEEPVSHTVLDLKREDNAEVQLHWQSNFPSGAVLDATSSFVEKMPGGISVYGTAGELHMDPAFGHRDLLRLKGTATDPATGKRLKVDEAPKDRNHFILEAEALVAAARNGMPTLTAGPDGLADLVAMEAIYAAAS